MEKIDSQKPLWIIDNGHGCNTSGKRGTILKEWDFNRKVARFIMMELKIKYIQFINLVPDDVDMKIRDRVLKANSYKNYPKAVGLSIHGNAAEKLENNKKVLDPEPNGIETLHYYKSETAKKYAGIFQKNLIIDTGLRDRGLKACYRPVKYIENEKIKYKQVYKVLLLKATSMPFILTENGFYSNPEEQELMLNMDFQYKLAMSHVKSIIEINKLLT